MKILGTLAILLAIPGCRGTEPPSLIAGSWTISQLVMEGTDPFSGKHTGCSIVGVQVSFSGPAPRLEGSNTAGTYECHIGSAATAFPFPAGVLGEISLDGSALRFRLADISMAGTYEGGGTVTGTATATMTGYGVLSGAFRMVR